MGNPYRPPGPRAVLCRYSSTGPDLFCLAGPGSLCPENAAVSCGVRHPLILPLALAAACLAQGPAHGDGGARGLCGGDQLAVHQAGARRRALPGEGGS